MTGSIEWVMTLFVTAGLLFFIVFWLYYDRRDRQFYDRQRHRRIFHCIKCGRLYANKGLSEVGHCPDCNTQNTSLRF